MLIGSHLRNTAGAELPVPLVRFNGNPGQTVDTYPATSGHTLATDGRLEVCLPFVTDALRGKGAFIALFRETSRRARGGGANRNRPQGNWVHPVHAASVSVQSSIPYPGTSGRSSFGGGQDYADIPRRSRIYEPNPVWSDARRWTDVTDMVLGYVRMMRGRVLMADPTAPWNEVDAMFLTRTGFSRKNSAPPSQSVFDSVNGVDVAVPLHRPAHSIPIPRFVFAVVMPDPKASDGYRIGGFSSIVTVRTLGAPYIENPNYMNSPYHPTRNPTGNQPPFLVALGTASSSFQVVFDVR